MRKLTILVVAMAAALAATANTWTDSKTGVTWYYYTSGGGAYLYKGSYEGTAISTSTTGELVIPATFAGCPLVSIGDYAFYTCRGITSVTIPEGVTTIGSYAFCHCSSLTRIVIPDSVRSIGEYAFLGCSALESVSIPNYVSSIGNSVFYGCGSLTSVTIPSGVTSLGAYAFNSCIGLEHITIPNGVTAIGDYAFGGCKRLESVSIGSGVRSIGTLAFGNCGVLASISVASNNSYYSTVNGLLLTKDCSTLLQGVCGDVTIPSSVVRIGAYAFYYCTGLTSVTLPDSVVSIDDNAFYGCSALTSVMIPANVTSIGASAFGSCVSLASINVDMGNCYYSSVDGLLLTKDGKTLVQGVCGDVTIPSCVTCIGTNAFYASNGLKSVIIGNSVTNIGSYAFYNCTKLMSVTIGNSVVNIGSYAFYNCTKLMRIVIPMSVTQVGDFAFCKSWNHDAAGYILTFNGLPINSAPTSAFRGCFFEYPASCEAEWVDFSRELNNAKTIVSILSSRVREEDPTVIDVRYIVYRSGVIGTSANVRALAYEVGERGFAKVVRPETFIDGTATNIGDNVAANVEHTLSWKVSSDWATRLAKVKFEVLASDGELLPLELRTIPASDRYGKLEFSRNEITTSQVFDALLWLYADKDTGLTLSNGILRNGSTQLASGNGTTNPSAISYIYSKMGYNLLSGSVLNYVNSETRLGLSPSGARQYAYKIVEDGE